VWTPARDATLVALHGTGLSYAAIASHMGISQNAAGSRIAVLIRRGVLPAKRGKYATDAELRSAAYNSRL
jgi:hypothetical protein